MITPLDRLLAGTKNPFHRSAFVAALRSKAQIVVTSLPVDLLLPTFFMATIAKEWKEEDVVDDYVLLRESIKAEFEAEVPRFWHPEGSVASCIVYQGAELSGNYQVEYLFNCYRELTGTFVNNAKSPFAAKRKKSA